MCRFVSGVDNFYGGHGVFGGGTFTGVVEDVVYEDFVVQVTFGVLFEVGLNPVAFAALGVNEGCGRNGMFDEHRAAIAVVFGVIASCATALGPVHFKGDEGAARHFEIHDGHGFIGAVDGGVYRQVCIGEIGVHHGLYFDDVLFGEIPDDVYAVCTDVEDTAPQADGVVVVAADAVAMAHHFEAADFALFQDLTRALGMRKVAMHEAADEAIARAFGYLGEKLGVFICQRKGFCVKTCLPASRAAGMISVRVFTRVRSMMA